MTIDQVAAIFREEKRNAVTSRFPCRAVMVKNIRQYRELISKLKGISDISLVPSDALFSSADVMPQYEKLKDSQYWDQWVILPGVSEYLRLFGKSEEETQRFAKLWRSQVPATSKGRILIPLWGCQAQWHDKALHLCDDVRQEDHYYDCGSEDANEGEDEQRLDILVLSGQFEPYIPQLAAKNKSMCIGLRAWYEYWAEPGEDWQSLLLLTKRHASVQPTSGSINIRVIRDSFSFIRENLMNTQALTEENCPKEAQALLFDHALAGGSLDSALLSALNVDTFSWPDIMSQWCTMGLGKKQLAALWMKLHPDESYLCHCVLRAGKIEEIPDHVLHDIFAVYNTYPQWVDESRKLIDMMHLQRDERYYSELEKIPVYEDRLKFLSAATKDDRIHLLRMAGSWMRRDPAQVLSCECLKSMYPELVAYLDGSGYDVDLARYFALYKSYKLSNTLPDDDETYFAGIRPEDHDFRYPVLSDDLSDSSFILWVDALGAEWLPLLTWSLQQSHAGKVRKSAVVQANLPTETCFNDQWKQMNIPHDKRDKLDKLAHTGVIDDPDYYTCIEEQIAFVAALRKEVDELANNYQRIIITGDHGTSRLAARFFHKRDGAAVPDGATVYSHGRYCKIPEKAEVLQPNIVYAKDSDGTHYAVFSSYDHFKQSGFAAGPDDDHAIYGEIHGGASPEEMLVPVVVFDSSREMPLTASWQTNPVKIAAKKARAKIAFSRPVQLLQARIGGAIGECSCSADHKVWKIVFFGLPAGTYDAVVIADGNLIQAEPLTILPALGVGSGDLP